MADDRNLQADGSGESHTRSKLVEYAPQLILLVVLIVFAAVNTRRVRIDFVFTSARVPLFVALLVAAVLGAAIGWFARRRRHS